MSVLAAFLSFLAWRFSFGLRDAAVLLLLPPLSFFAIGASRRTACDDDHSGLFHMGHDLASWNPGRPIITATADTRTRTHPAI